MSTVHVIASHKGGVGKSTAAVHLAAVFHELGDGPVLLVDGDARESAIRWSDLAAEMGDPFPFPTVRFADIARRWSEEVDGYKTVVVDSGPTPREIREAGEHATTAVVVTRPGVLDLDRIPETVEILDGLGVPTVVAVNALRSSTNAAVASVEAIEQSGLPVGGTIPLRQEIEDAVGAYPNRTSTYFLELAELLGALAK